MNLFAGRVKCHCTASLALPYGLYSPGTIYLGLTPPPQQPYVPIWIILQCCILKLSWLHYISEILKNWMKQLKNSTYVKFNAIMVMLILCWCRILSCTDIMTSSNKTIKYFFCSSVKFTMFNTLLIWQGTLLLSCNHCKWPSLLM